MRFAPRRAAAGARESTAPASSIARALEVATLLSGSVRREGARRRVTAELTDANGDVLWSDVYQHEARDVFAVQDEITRAIVGGLRVQLAGAVPVGDQGTDDAVAYDLYLRGRHLVALRGADNLRRAIDYFERALAADPEFARSWAGLADAIGLLPWYGDTPIDSAAAPARRAAERAIALDSTLADGYTALGNVLPYTRDWARME